MPSASLETLENWPHGEAKAHELLAENFLEINGYYYPSIEGYKATKTETAALLYLIEEWDYGYLNGPSQAESFQRELNEMYQLLSKEQAQ
jgi:hypothetical protein